MAEQASERWISVRADRVLYVNRGREIILSSNHTLPDDAELLLQITQHAADDLRRELGSTLFGENGQ